MIYLNKIKVAVFDFDDTLAIHKDKNYIQRRKGSNDYYIQAYLHPDTFYETIEPCYPSLVLQNVTAYCRLNNIPMFCVSGMRFSLHMDAKIAFIQKHYGNDIKFIIASSQERKADVVQVLKETNRCDTSEILFVDDMDCNISNMSDLGYSVVSVNDLKNIRVSENRLLMEYMDD